MWTCSSMRKWPLFVWACMWGLPEDSGRMTWAVQHGCAQWNPDKKLSYAMRRISWLRTYFELQFAIFLLIMGDCDLLWMFWIMLTMDMLVLHCLMFEGFCWLTMIVWLINNCARMTCCIWMSKFWVACVSKGWVLPTCKSQTIWGWPHGCKNMIFLWEEELWIQNFGFDYPCISHLIIWNLSRHEIDFKVYD